EITAFSDVAVHDSVTQKLAACCAGWHRIVGMPDAQVADLIRTARIDILVDLALHSRLNRLLVFARKPAPVQVTYLGYPGTTGLAAIDYRLTDRHLDPPDSSALYVEHSFPLSASYWCYTIPENAPD